MSTTPLSLSNLELVSTLRVAPLSGPPISEDYNDGEQEKLVDLTTIVTFLNNTLLPMLNTLAATSSTGIDGSGIYGDLTSEEQVFFNSLTSTSLSVADSLRLINGQSQTLQTNLASLATQVAALQARLSSTNQNDISLALQGFTSTLNLQQSELQALQLAVSSLQQIAGTSMEAQAGTPAVDPQAIETVTLLWSIDFPDNTYTVSYGIEDASGFLQVTGFSYLADGTGILVRVLNTDSQAPHQGTVQAIGRVSQLTSIN
jgi:hypothetical protein